jgi:hypothetical protein
VVVQRHLAKKELAQRLISENASKNKWPNKQLTQMQMAKGIIMDCIKNKQQEGPNHITI